MSVGAINKQTGDRIPTAGTPAIDDALDLTSVNPVQNAVITAALALKQDKTDNSLQTTDKTVVGAVNELKSGLTNLTNDVKLNTQDLTTPSRTKNVLPMTLAGIKSLNTTGTWNNNVYTENGVDFAVNTDTNGNVINITVNGTSSGVIYFYVADNLNYLGTFNGKYTVNGGVSGGRANTYALQVYSETNSILINCYESKDYIIEHTTYSNSAITSAVIVVRSGVTVENLVFTPMIRLSTETDPTFAPYIPSVESRIEAVESNLTGNWRQVTFADVFTFAQDVTASLGQNCVAWVRGDRVRIKLFVSGSITTTSTGYKTIGNVSNNYRPANNTIMPGFVNSRSDGTQMLASASYAINTNGNINLLYGDTATLGSVGSDWLGGNSILFEWSIK